MLPSTYLRSFVERSIECFQPIVNLNTDHRLGAETPVRFVDPDDTLRVSSGIVEQSEENLGDLETLMWRLFRSISMTIGAMLERRQKTRWSSHIPG